MLNFINAFSLLRCFYDHTFRFYSVKLVILLNDFSLVKPALFLGHTRHGYGIFFFFLHNAEFNLEFLQLCVSDWLVIIISPTVHIRF